MMEGTCILWQVLVKAPGTANNATFLPLKMSSVVFHAGPSGVITRNFASGSGSPTLIGMIVILSLRLKPCSKPHPGRSVAEPHKRGTLEHVPVRWSQCARHTRSAPSPLVGEGWGGE